MVEEAVALSASNEPCDARIVDVHDDGSIFFNDTPMINSNPPARSGQLSRNLPQCFKTIMSKSVMLASFGGGGEFNGNPVGYWDFSAIKTLIGKYPRSHQESVLPEDLAFMFDTYPWIRGIDLDLECNSLADYQSFTTTLDTIIKWLGAGKYACTLCRYQFPDFWVDVIKRAGGAGQITWVNLQNADGTAGEFVGPLKSAGIGAGQIVGGLQVGEGMQPYVTQEFATLVKQYPGFRGGWL